jgi:hypothetical protein
MSMIQRLMLSRCVMKDRIQRLLLGLPPSGVSLYVSDTSELGEVIANECFPSLRDMRRLIMPSRWDADCLRVEAPPEIQRKATEVLLEPRSPGTPFGVDASLVDILGDICMLLMQAKAVPIRLIRGTALGEPPTDGSPHEVKHVIILRPGGVEDLDPGGYQVHATAYNELHRRYVRDSRIGDLVPKRDIVLYQRPHSWGELPPLLAALPAILASRRLMEEMLLIASAMASDRPTLRQQFVRRRPMNIDQRDSMVHAQKSIALGASILEYSPFNPRLLETFTQYFLAWQHREALIRASDLRDIVLQTTNRELLPELSTLWGRPALGVRVKVEGGLTRERTETLFKEFEAGSLSLSEFHRESTSW